MTYFRVTVQDHEPPDEQANKDEITLSDEDWAVIIYLRQHYLKLGQLRHTSLQPRDPDTDKKFFVKCTNKYLRLLFACSSVTQNSRLANPLNPRSAIDNSPGICG